MSDPKILQEPCDPTQSACSTSAFQQVCVTTQVTVTPDVCCNAPIVTCIGDPSIVTGAASPCPGGVLSPTGSCSFFISQQLCVEIPVQFRATATCDTGQVFCFPPSTSPDACTPTPPVTCPFFEPRSAGFYMQNFNLTDFTAEQLCSAIQCVESRSEYLASLLALGGCPAPGEPCPNATFVTCVAQGNALLVPGTVLAQAQLICPGAPNSFGAATRQFFAGLLNVCFCTTTIGGQQVGGVSPGFTVDLSGFPPAVQALFGPAPVTVQTVINVADAAFVACDFATIALIEPVLAAMAQDPGTTIIQPA